ncbi:1-acyl-sn-glycerol-3-phosphate acyltransferase [Hellea sp.]|nr:1-acyl-sn-glycerol-3-phosphate acyltransferase [Hellea sp.]
MAQYDHVTNAHVPQRGNRLTKWLGATILNILGWKIVGEFPQESKVVFIGVPHTSNWDLIIAVASMQAVGLRASWMMKKEAFFWPLSGFFKKLGGVPIDRKSKSDLTTQMADWFAANDKAWLGITPEGTRSKVKALKKGYLRIAYAAKVPVFLIALDAENKHVVLDRVWPLTLDTEVDNRKIKAYYDKTYKGIRPELG